MPTINLDQTPSSIFDMAYGPNPVSLSGLTINEDKFVLRIKNSSGDIIADVRQTPNKQYSAVFDIQKILQNEIGVGGLTVDSLNYPSSVSEKFALHTNELFEYTIEYGYEVDGVAYVTGTYGPLYVLAGSKAFYEVPFNVNQYIPKISPTFPEVTRTAKVLSDNKYTIPYDNYDTILNDYIIAENLVDVHNVYPDDQCTFTISNELENDGAGSWIKHCVGYWVVWCNDTNILSQIFVNNVVANGGGPDVDITSTFDVTKPYKTLTIPSGPANVTVAKPSAANHYYIIPVAYDPAGSATPPYSVSYTVAWRAQRYNLLEPACNDYDHVQFSWVNSKGFKDQFTFTKKLTRSTSTKRETYLKSNADFNGYNYSALIQDRGTTIYGQTISDTYSVTSGFMTDLEAQSLQSLFQSPEVKVRFSAGDYKDIWIPVTLTSTTWDEKTYRKDKLFQYTVNFTLANTIKAQNG